MAHSMLGSDRQESWPTHFSLHSEDFRYCFVVSITCFVSLLVTDVLMPAFHARFHVSMIRSGVW